MTCTTPCTTPCTTGALLGVCPAPLYPPAGRTGACRMLGACWHLLPAGGAQVNWREVARRSTAPLYFSRVAHRRAGITTSDRLWNLGSGRRCGTWRIGDMTPLY